MINNKRRMGENEMPSDFYSDINGRCERIGKIKEMRIFVDESDGVDKTAATVAAIYEAERVFIVAMRAFSKTTTAIQAFAEMMIRIYPNKRIAWLALHHKKMRVRKKNIKRILKGYEMVYDKRLILMIGN